MNRRKFFESVLSIVERVSEIPRERILSGEKLPESVDARFMLVYILSQNGLYGREIARLSGISRQSVATMIRTFERRRAKGGPIFEIIYQQIVRSVSM